MRTSLLALSALLVAPALASAQGLQSNNTVLFAQYQCAADQLARADALVNDIIAPVLNKHVASGKLLSWGYVGVYIGDQNNRSIYVWAADPVALMQARELYLPEITAVPQFAEFSRICGTATIAMHNLIAAAAPQAR
jgi:hypothetical protein